MVKRMSPRAEATAWWVVAALVVVAIAVSCWRNVSEVLGRPIQTQLGYGGGSGLEAITGGTAHASATGVIAVGVQLTHVSAQLQWLVALSKVNSSLIATAVILVLGILWIRTSSGQPFTPSVTRSLGALSIIVAGFGTLQEILDSWVRMRAAYEAVGRQLVPSGAYFDAQGLTVTGIPIFIALGIGLVASAFAIGARLSKETEGLV